MKSDTQLQKDVMDELRWDPSVSEREIAVAVKDGVVTLGGHVQSFAQKRAAEHAVSRVAGVKAVAEDILVKLPTSLLRSDTEIAHAAINALKWDTEVPDELLKTKVENGWITLEGAVEFFYQKTAAERSVRFLNGVKGVTNLISVKPGVGTTKVSENIEAALKRRAEMDAARITVDTRDGKVTLRGSVHSWLELKEAENAAWATPGVWSVEDRLAVVP
ncbi:MAG TPA: BON domain-containing protein [Gemmatimonadaceae bacterium]